VACVLAARATQQERFKGLRKTRCNAVMRTKELHKHCRLKPDAQAKLKMAIPELHFSAPPSSRYPPALRDRDYGGQAGSCKIPC